MSVPGGRSGCEPLSRTTGKRKNSPDPCPQNSRLYPGVLLHRLTLESGTYGSQRLDEFRTRGESLWKGGTETRPEARTPCQRGCYASMFCGCFFNRLEQRKRRVEHRIVGTIYDALSAPPAVQKKAGIRQGRLRLTQAFAHQALYLVASTQIGIPSSLTAMASKECRSGPVSHSARE